MEQIERNDLLEDNDDSLTGLHLTGLHQKQKYHVQSKIAEGGMAWVYEAREEESDSPIALKILFPQYVSAPLTRERFIKEGDIQRRIHHPHIVRVFDVVDEQKVLCLALEWMDGGDLAEFIGMRGNSPFTIELIWGLFSPILRAIHCAHEEGIVHRDFKPANVMLKWEGEYLVPKLADFGIAKIREAANSRTSTGSVMGTFKYMPPEQLNDSKQVDRRADLYSIGITLYRMATGYFPFQGNTESIIFRQMFAEPMKPSELNPSIPLELELLILKCLEKKPEDRFQDAMQLLNALAAVPRNDEHQLSPEETVTYNLSTMAKARLKSGPRGLSVKKVFSNQNLIEGSIHSEGSQPGSQQLRQLAQLDQQLPQEGKTAHLRSVSTVHLRSAPTVYSQEQLTAPEHSTKSLKVALGIATGILLSILGFLLFGTKTSDTSKKPLAVNHSLENSPRHPLKKGTSTDPKSKGVPALVTCKTGEARSCYPGPPSAKGKGLCKAGTQSCLNGKWGTCIGAVFPAQQERCNGLDDDCDGLIDEQVPKVGKSCTTRHGDCIKQGTFACHNKRLFCKSTNSGSTKFITLRTERRRQVFSIRYAGKRHSFRSSTCLPIKKKTQVFIWAKGYQLCTFALRTHRSTVKLRMKRSSGISGLEDDAPNYCVRRK
mgnify:CR=1 FL=1